MVSSTDDGAGYWPLERIGVDAVSSLFRCSPKEAKQRLDEIRAQQSDPVWLGKLLDELSVPSLSILSLVADHVILVESELVELARSVYALKPDELRAALGPLLRHLLVVPLRTMWGAVAYSLVEPSASWIAERLGDFSLGTAAGSPFVADAAADGGRALLAACAALRQLDVKLTQTGAPHRTAVKRLAKQLGLPEDRLEALLMTALNTGLVQPDPEDVLRPDLERMEDAAGGRYAHDPAAATLRAHFEANAAALPAAIVDSWFRRCASAGVRRGAALSCTAGELARLPGFASGTISGAPAIGLAPVDGVAAASLTPGFELFLPPESSPLDVVRALAGADVGRIDRVIVARITKASIGRATAAGATAAELLAALSRACRTPIPQNVEAAIRDWAADGTLAVSAVGRVVVVAGADEQRAATALHAFSPRILGPGVLLVDAEVQQRAIAAALAKASIHLRSEALGAAPAAGTHAPPEAPRSSRVPAVPGTAETAVVRARLEAYRRGDPAERALARVLPAGTPPGPKVELAFDGEDFDDEDFDDEDFDDEDFDDDLEVSPHSRLLQLWVRGHAAKLSLEEIARIEALFERISVHDRNFVLGAIDVESLRERIERIVARDPARDQIRSRGGTAAPDELAWDRTHHPARLEAAARTRSTLVLDLGGSTPTVRVTKVAVRGSAVMVFAESIPDEVRIAVPLAKILGVAEPRSHPAGAEVPAEAPAPTWRPVEGQAVPAGHIACPCGSGRKYRACCRPKN